MPDEPSQEADGGRIVTIGDLKIRRAQRFSRDPARCAHNDLEMQADGEIIVCMDCSRQVSAYWVLGQLLDQYRDAWRAVRSEWEQARWERKKTVRMVAARKIEDAWRRGMAPCCPHCDRAILPEDGLGEVQVNRALEVARRGDASPKGEVDAAL